MHVVSCVAEEGGTSPLACIHIVTFISAAFNATVGQNMSMHALSPGTTSSYSASIVDQVFFSYWFPHMGILHKHCTSKIDPNFVEYGTWC